MAKSENTGRKTWPRQLGRGIAWVAVLAIIVIGGSRVNFDVNPVRLLPQKLPEVQGLTAYLDQFSRSDELIVTVDGDVPTEVDEAARSLAERLRARADVASAVILHPPGEEDPDAMSELIAYLLINQEPGKLDEFVNSLDPGESKQRIERTIDTMTFDLSPAAALLGGYDPLGLVPAAFGGGGGGGPMTMGGANFGSKDGKLRLIYVWSADRLARKDYLKLIAWTKEVRAIVHAWQAETPSAANVRVRLSGEPAIMGEVSGSMQGDLSTSGFSTALFVALIFWGVYRKLRPLLALLAMLTLVILLTFGLSGLFIPELNVMNIGFASILIGLTDYGILVYQQSLVTPGDPKRIRAATLPGILCAATTTAASFASLMASSQPSLAKLGAIVATGVLVGAAVMLLIFVPWVCRMPRSTPQSSPVDPPPWLLLGETSSRVVAVFLALALCAAVATLCLKGLPGVDATDHSVRPRISEAYDALDDMTRALTGSNSAGSLIVHAHSGIELRRELEQLKGRLNKEVESGTMRSFLVPTAFAPVPSYQQANAERAVSRLLLHRDRLADELAEAGFGPESTILLDAVLARLKSWSLGAGTIPPETSAVRWLLQRLVGTGTDGSAWAATNYVATPGADLSALQSPQVFLADWGQTMRAVTEQAPKELGMILLMLAGAVMILLIITFRRCHEIGWVILCMTLSAVLALGWMSLAGWRWDFFNAAAILLCLGGGIDYSIHMLLALRRGEPVNEIMADTGRGVLVCALTSVVGFASLAWASNTGLASLGKVCALALGMNCLVATYLLPRLWQLAHSPRPSHP